MKKTRKVTIRLVIEGIVMPVPDDFDEDMINFLLNESGRCIDNTIRAFCREFNEMPENECLCGRAWAEYVGECEAEVANAD